MSMYKLARYAATTLLLWVCNLYCAAQVTFYIPPTVAIKLDTTEWQLPYTTPYYFSARSFIPGNKGVLTNKKNGLKISVHIAYYGARGVETAKDWSSYMFCKNNTLVNGMQPKQRSVSYGNGALDISYVDTTVPNMVIYFDTNCPTYDAAMLKEVKAFIANVRHVAPSVIDKAAGYPLNHRILTDSVYATRPYPVKSDYMPEPISWRLYHFLDYKFNFNYAAYHQAQLKSVLSNYTRNELDCMAFGVFKGNEGQLMVDSVVFDNPYSYNNEKWNTYLRNNTSNPDDYYRRIKYLAFNENSAWSILYSDTYFALCHATTGAQGNLILNKQRISIARWRKDKMIYRRQPQEFSVNYGYGMDYQSQKWLDNNQTIGALSIYTNQADAKGIIEAAPIYYLFRTDVDSMQVLQFAHEYENTFDYIVMPDDHEGKNVNYNGVARSWYWNGENEPFRIFSKSDDERRGDAEISPEYAGEKNFVDSLITSAANASTESILYCIPLFMQDLDNDNRNEIVSALVSNGQLVDYKICTITRDGFLNQNKSEHWQSLLYANDKVSKWIANSKQGLSPFMQEALDKVKKHKQAASGILDLDAEERLRNLVRDYNKEEGGALQAMRVIQIDLLNSWQEYLGSEFTLKMALPNEWLKQNLKYPAKEKAAKRGCVVAIDFDATPTGDIVNIKPPQTDKKNEMFVAEATRLLRLIGSLNPPAEGNIPSKTAMQFVVHFIP